jgi:hypothetical protein
MATHAATNAAHTARGVASIRDVATGRRKRITKRASCYTYYMPPTFGQIMAKELQ